MSELEKDYPVIGELARIMPQLEDQVRFSRSARDLCSLAEANPGKVASLVPERPLLAHAIDSDTDRLAEALDAERRGLIKADAERMGKYEHAASGWREAWPRVRRSVEGLPLQEAHRMLLREASGLLPERVC